jgi:hypothetical protein
LKQKDNFKNKAMEKQLTDEEVMEVKNIHLPDRVYSMNEIIKKIGIKNKIIYFNNVEKKTKDLRCPFVVIEKTTDKALLLENGIIIKHIESKVWKQIIVDVIKIRERNGIAIRKDDF